MGIRPDSEMLKMVDEARAKLEAAPVNEMVRRALESARKARTPEQIKKEAIERMLFHRPPPPDELIEQTIRERVARASNVFEKCASLVSRDTLIPPDAPEPKVPKNSARASWQAAMPDSARWWLRWSKHASTVEEIQLSRAHCIGDDGQLLCGTSVPFINCAAIMKSALPADWMPCRRCAARALELGWLKGSWDVAA